MPWRRDRAGHWASQDLPLAFGLDGRRAAVYARDGHRFPREGEVKRAMRERVRRLRDQEQLWLAERQRHEAAEAAPREQERRRREDGERLEQPYAAELERRRRRQEALERGR